MKKQSISNSTKATLAKFSAAILLWMGSLSPVSAQQAAEPGQPFVSIKHIGSIDERTQFQFDLVTDSDEGYLFSVQEHDGTILYREKIDARSFTRKFAWNNLDINSSKLIFSITGLKTKKTQVFEVKKQLRTIEDVVINKL